AQDWAEMLYRMYTRWAANHGMNVEVLDYQDGDEAGIKSASIMVKGTNAYGLLKSENGVHRLVRVSPFDSNARRQTSFASLEVMPELDNTIEVNIRPEDIEMQVYRSSGAGGQHINKTSSAVRLIHKPTGIVVSCQTQRSQFQNRDYAMQMLKAKLYQIAQQQHMDKIEDIKGVQNEIAWGHQIRSYVFMPYTMVKDHRTSYETSNVNAVMDGDLDGFIFAYLKAASRGELQDAGPPTKPDKKEARFCRASFCVWLHLCRRLSAAGSLLHRRCQADVVAQEPVGDEGRDAAGHLFGVEFFQQGAVGDVGGEDGGPAAAQPVVQQAVQGADDETGVELGAQVVQDQ